MKHMKMFAAMILATLMVIASVSFAEPKWEEREEGRYLVTEEGKNIKGWYQDGNDWYYLNGKGVVTGWFVSEPGIFHADEEGKVDEGWMKYKGIWYNLRRVNIGTDEEPNEIFRWYYVEEAETGKRQLGNRSYDISNKKSKLTGWTMYDGNYIYFNEDGSADVGWHEVEGEMHYSILTGYMATGKMYIGDRYYTFDKKGVTKDDTTNIQASNATERSETTKETIQEPSSNVNPSGNSSDKKEESRIPSTVNSGNNKANNNDGKSADSKNEGNKTAAPAKVDEKVNNNQINDNKDNNSTKAQEQLATPVVITVNETIIEAIPYETEYQNDNSRYPEDGNKTIQAGVNGKKEITYKVTYTDGVETGREKIEEKTTEEPVKEIISVPSKGHSVEVKEETNEETIAFTTETRNDDTRIEGEADQVIQEGVNGKIVTVYAVTYTDGVETKREVKSENRTEPVTKIISHATGAKPTTTTKNITEKEEIPYSREVIELPTEYKGNEYVSRPGQNGEKEVVYSVTYDADGTEISRSVVSENITKYPISETYVVGTFVPTVTYDYVDISLPGMHGTRDGGLDSECKSWAMSMAKNGVVEHSTDVGVESVGGWGSASAAASGVASHGGDSLAWSEFWGAGCVKLTYTTPGGTHTVYYAAAKGGGAYTKPLE